jgi:CTP:molybdopterin cytidylyltransferase MocA
MRDGPIVVIPLAAGSATRFGSDKLTRLSQSKTRRVAAMGNSRIIPAQAGIQRGLPPCLNRLGA